MFINLKSVQCVCQPENPCYFSTSHSQVHEKNCMAANDCLNLTTGFCLDKLLLNSICKVSNSNIKGLENAAAIRQKLGFQDERRQEEAIPKRGFVEKEVSFIKYTSSQTRRFRLFFQKGKNSLTRFWKNTQKYAYVNSLTWYRYD